MEADELKSSDVLRRKANIDKSLVTSKTRKKRSLERLMEADDEINQESLMNFNFLHKELNSNNEILVDLPLHSHEYTNIIHLAVTNSFLYPQTACKVKISKAELVMNAFLEKEFVEKKKRMRQNGRIEKELSVQFGYLQACNKYEVDTLCKNGIETGNCSLVSLGKASMGVYLCKHADVTTPIAFEANDSGYIVVFKFLKGKVKLVPEFRGISGTREPTPLHDCHVIKSSNGSSKMSHVRAYQALQYYVYEYDDDRNIKKRPRQILPYAVLHYTYLNEEEARKEADRVSGTVDVSNDNTSNSESGASVNFLTFCLWEGKLLVKDDLFCSVKMGTDIDCISNTAFLEKQLNIKSFMPLYKFMKHMPPSLLSRTSKKHNLVYRGRCYNAFNLVPANQSDFEKFRCIIAYLVQQQAVAYLATQMSTSVYLLAKSSLTMDRMGLLPPGGENSISKTLFLHVIIATPKSLTTKINDQRVFNVLNVRKKKDSQADNKIPHDLDQKLRGMNIDSNAAVGSMPGDQISALLSLLQGKRKLQVTDKLMHQHYKNNDSVLNNAKSRKSFSEKLKVLWQLTSESRSEHPSKRKPILKSTVPISSSATAAKSSILGHSSSVDVADVETVEDESDEEVPLGKLRLLTGAANSTGYDPHNSNKPRFQVKKRQISSEMSINDDAPAAKLSRPTFKPLEEVICKDRNQTALIMHPDYTFTERFQRAHKIMKGSNYTTEHDITPKNQISVNFCQKLPFDFTKDCSYASDGDSLIKSMLRAIYGPKNEKEEEDKDGHEKVLWVRQVLHQSSNNGEDAVTEDVPSFKQTDGNSSNEPTSTPPPLSLVSDQQSSLRDVVTSLINSMQDSSSNTGNDLIDKDGYVQHSVLKALTNSIVKEGILLPNALKSVTDEPVSEPSDDIDVQNPNDFKRIPVDKTEANPATTQADPSKEPPKAPQLTGHPQDPRLNRNRGALGRISIPSYRFPLPEAAADLLPKDAEAAQNLQPLDAMAPEKTQQSPRSRITRSLAKAVKSMAVRDAQTPTIQTKDNIDDPSKKGKGATPNRNIKEIHVPSARDVYHITSNVGDSFMTVPTVKLSNLNFQSLRQGKVSSENKPPPIRMNQNELITVLLQVGSNLPPPPSPAVPTPKKTSSYVNTLLGRNTGLIFKNNSQATHLEANTGDSSYTNDKQLVGGTKSVAKNRPPPVVRIIQQTSNQQSPENVTVKFYTSTASTSTETSESASDAIPTSLMKSVASESVADTTVLTSQSSVATSASVEKKETNQINESVSSHPILSQNLPSNTSDGVTAASQITSVADAVESVTTSCVPSATTIADTVLSTSVPTPHSMQVVTSSSLANVLSASVSQVIASNTVPTSATDGMLSEIENILNSVRVAQETNISTDVLSSRLLEIALQLRGEPSSLSATADSALPVTSSISSGPSVTVCIPETTFPLASVAMTSVTASSRKYVHTDEKMSDDGISSTNADTIVSHIPVMSTGEPQFMLNAANCMKSVSLQPNPNLTPMDVEDADRDAHTPTMDETSDSMHAHMVKRSYKAIQPLSSVARAGLSLGTKVLSVLQRATLDRGQEVTGTMQGGADLMIDNIYGNATPQFQAMFQSRVFETANFQNDAKASDVNFSRQIRFKAPSPPRPQVAHVKPQPSHSNLGSHSFYVFNPRGNRDCDDIESLLLTTKGIPFHMEIISDNVGSIIASSHLEEDSMIPVSKEMIENSLRMKNLWIVIRTVDLELLPALPYLSLLKCAGRKVQFVQADTAADVQARQYTNILNGECGILLPVSVDVLLDNAEVFRELLIWMTRVAQRHMTPIWRLALYNLIQKQLTSKRQSLTDDVGRTKANLLLDVIEKHRGVIISIPVKENDITNVSASEVFDTAASLQLRYVSTARHIVALTATEQQLTTWQLHRRAGIAVATVNHFVQAIMESKVEKAQTDTPHIFSPLIKIYRVDK